MTLIRSLEGMLRDLQKAISNSLATGIVLLFLGMLWRFFVPVLATVSELSDKKFLVQVIAALSIILLLSISWAFILRSRLRTALKTSYGFDPLYGCLIDLKTNRKLCPKCRHPLMDMSGLFKCAACGAGCLKLGQP